MAHEFRLPDIGEGLVDAEIVQWHVNTGDVVSEGDVLVEVETAKAVVEITSPFSGTVLQLGAAAGRTVEVGSVLVVIGEPGESLSTGEAEPAILPPAAAAAASAPEAASVQAMPVVRKLARKHGIDLATVQGTGPGGRITRADLERLVGGGEPTTTADAVEERVPLTRLRRTIAEHMVRSWSEIPHVTVFDEFDATRMLSARSGLEAQIGRAVPLEALVVKAVIAPLVEHPEFNATVDGDSLVVKRHYDIAVAVDTPEGLIVPVVHGAADLDAAQLADRIVALADQARTRRLAPDALVGGTFTISNIGAVGGGMGTPIIPLGTTAILSIGRAVDTPVVRDEAVVVRPMAPLSLSYDHRVIDGAMGQRFMARLVAELEVVG